MSATTPSLQSIITCQGQLDTFLLINIEVIKHPQLNIQWQLATPLDDWINMSKNSWYSIFIAETCAPEKQLDVSLWKMELSFLVVVGKVTFELHIHWCWDNWAYWSLHACRSILQILLFTFRHSELSWNVTANGLNFSRHVLNIHLSSSLPNLSWFNALVSSLSSA